MKYKSTQFGVGSYSDDTFERLGLKEDKYPEKNPEIVGVRVIQVSDPYYEWALKYPNGKLVYIDPYDQERYDKDGKMKIKNIM